MKIGFVRSMGWAALACALPSIALAQFQVPGPADAGRVEQRAPSIPEPMRIENAVPQTAPAAVGAPKGSETIHFHLKVVELSGVTAFTKEQLLPTYAEYLGKDITLDKLWVIAAAITKQYQDAGYFLARAYVPAQEVDAGTVRIEVVEGSIHDVDIQGKYKDNPIAITLAERLKSFRPVTSKEVESTLLQLNDIPGAKFRSVLVPAEGENARPGDVNMQIIPLEQRPTVDLGFDNYGSQYLGPLEWTARYTASIFQGHETELTKLAATRVDELDYYSLRHRWMATPDLTFDAGASYTKSSPGYTLSQQNIDSVSRGYQFGVTTPWIRQRDENLSTRVALELRDTRSTIFGVFPLTRDRIRVARGTVNYEVADAWAGYNLGSVTFSQGIDGLGSSHAGDANLSRAQAEPDFRKAEFTASRLQAIGSQWNLLASTNGQLASGPLYSSEEFGYGGQAFGRAYDSSEITGDHGIAAALEIRYNGLPQWGGFTASPYGFYDIGAVYNDDAGQEKKASGSSAGLGVRIAHEIGMTANVGVAFPLTREVATPISGDGNDPRWMMQMQYSF